VPRDELSIDLPAPPGGGSRAAAQRRADRIAAFRAELAALADDGVLALAPEQRRRVDEHHERLLADLAGRYAVDLAEGERRLSLGMRIASLVGALALAASFYYAVYRVWGLIPTALQVAIVVGAPLAGLALTALAGRRDRSGYFAGLAGLFTLAAFVVGVAVVGQVFNMTPSPGPFLAWGALGVALGVGWGLRLPLAAGLASALFWTAAAPMAWSGHPWEAAFERPEGFLPGALALLALPFVSAAARREELGPVFRWVGGGALSLALVVLGSWGAGSYLPWPVDAVEAAYQVAGFLAAAALAALGVRRGWNDLVHLGTVAFVVLLWIKFVDWWWDWMPKSLFFLLVALIALAAMVALARLRRLVERRRR
jgi:uncharacterized membrane protein